MSVIDDIKNKLDIVEFIGEYLTLRPAGGGSFKAVCPFHKEKTPSFFVSADRQIWKCFGCGKGGDHFGFLKELEGIEFAEALKLLAKKTGVRLTKESFGDSTEKNKITEINELVANLYHYFLLTDPRGKNALAYLKNRGITEESIKTFRIGWAPQSHFLHEYCIKKKYTQFDIEKSGLVLYRGSAPYDRFHGRIVFPITDTYENVVGFSGRLLPEYDDGKTGKYINSPETAIYHKSSVLYGLDKAKSFIREMGYAIVVEGNIDVIAAHGADTKNTVAISGTSLTADQLRLLRRFTHTLYLCFDFDPAGESATARGVDLALKEEFNLKIISLPFGKDPDECIRKDSEAWRAAVRDAKPFAEHYFNAITKGKDISKVEDRKNITKNFLSIILKLSNLVERDFWIKKLSSTLLIDESIIREELKKAFAKIHKQRVIEDKPIKTIENFLQKVAERCIGILLAFPELYGAISTICHIDFFPTEQLQTIYRRIEDEYGNEKKFNKESFIKNSRTEEQYYIDFLTLLISNEEAAISEQTPLKKITQETDVDKKFWRRELAMTITILGRHYYNGLLIAETVLLKQYEKERDKDKMLTSLQKIGILSQRLKELEHVE